MRRFLSSSMAWVFLLSLGLCPVTEGAGAKQTKKQPAKVAKGKGNQQNKGKGGQKNKGGQKKGGQQKNKKGGGKGNQQRKGGNNGNNSGKQQKARVHSIELLPAKDLTSHIPKPQRAPKKLTGKTVRRPPAADIPPAIPTITTPLFEDIKLSGRMSQTNTRDHLGQTREQFLLIDQSGMPIPLPDLPSTVSPQVAGSLGRRMREAVGKPVTLLVRARRTLHPGGRTTLKVFRVMGMSTVAAAQLSTAPGVAKNAGAAPPPPAAVAGAGDASAALEQMFGDD